MRSALIATAAAVATLLVLSPASALADSPSAAQIHTAVARAEQSSATWATINICSSAGTARGGRLGVRGQMPALGFPATLHMTVQLSYWSQKHERFMTIGGPRATYSLSLGSPATGTQQGGAMFAFGGDPGLLSASVDFSWTRDGRVIAEANRITTRGHPEADYGQPAGYTADVCHLG